MCTRGSRHLWYTDTFTVRLRNVIRDWCVACGERRLMSALDGWQLGLHAVDRALDMAIDAHEIRETLMRPDVKQPSGPDYPDHQQIWAKGRIALVVDPAARYVVTILWRAVIYERGTDSEPFRDN